MTKEELKNSLSSWKDKYNVEEGIEALEEALKSNDLDFNNITAVFKYNREDCGEISIMTKPSSHISFIKFKKK